MARQGNFFAVLDDEEGDDVSKLLERVIAKVEASSPPVTAEKKKDQQSRSSSSGPKLPSNPHSTADYENWSGRGSHSHGSGRYSGNDVEQLENGYPNGYQQSTRQANYQRFDQQADGYPQDNRHVDGYQRDNRRADGYPRDNRQAEAYPRHNGRVDGYQRDNAWADGFQRDNRRGDGRDNGRGDGYRRDNGRADGYLQDNGQGDGYHRDNGRAYGYHQDNRAADGFRGDNRRVDYYRGDKKLADNYQRENREAGNYRHDDKQADGNRQDYAAGFVVNDNLHRQGRGHGGGRGTGRGKGREFNEDQGFGNDSRATEDNQQLESLGQEAGSGGSQEKLTKGQSFEDKRQLGNGKGSYGCEARGKFGDNLGSRPQGSRSSSGCEGTNYGRGEVIKSSETNEALINGEHINNGDSNSPGPEGNVPITTEASKVAEPEQGKHRQVGPRNHSENKKMTLEEYEKLLLEKRKALGVLKAEGRKATLDKDFELMQVVGKKKEDHSFVKLNSEKDKLKKKDVVDKDEKVPKSVSINEFLKPAEGEYYVRRGGRYIKRGGNTKGGYSSSWVSVEDDPVPEIGDSGQFPVLGGVAK